MSNLVHTIMRRVSGLFAREPVPLDPDSMALRDWADLPPHHPLHERAPC